MRVSNPDGVDKARLASSTAFGVTWRSEDWRQRMQEWIRKPHCLQKDVDMSIEERLDQYWGAMKEQKVLTVKHLYFASHGSPRIYHGALPLDITSRYYEELRGKGWELEPWILSDLYCRDRIARLKAEDAWRGPGVEITKAQQLESLHNIHHQAGPIRMHIALLREETLIMDQETRLRPTVSAMQSHVLQEKRQMIAWAIEDWQHELRRVENEKEAMERKLNGSSWVKGKPHFHDPTLPFFDSARGKAVLATAAVGGTVSGLTGASAGWWGNTVAKRRAAAPGNGANNGTQTVGNSMLSSTLPASNSTAKGP